MTPQEALGAQRRTGSREPLSRVAYELLEAHNATVRLAADLAHDQRWQVHLDYLRDLQCAGRKVLAQFGAVAGGPGMPARRF